MAWWLWLVIGFSLIAFEMFLPAGFALLIIGLAFVVTGITTGLGIDDPVSVQWFICLTTSVVLFFSIRRPLMRMFGLDSPSNYKEIEGQEITIIGKIPADTIGQGEMQGTQWKVRNVGSVPLSAGDVLKVLKIDGLTVEVKKQ